MGNVAINSKKYNSSKPHIKVSSRWTHNGTEYLPYCTVYVGSFIGARKAHDGRLYASLYTKEMFGECLLARVMNRWFSGEEIFDVMERQPNNSALYFKAQKRLREEAMRLAEIAARKYHYPIRP